MIRLKRLVVEAPSSNDEVKRCIVEASELE
jgi:hypothetical protein